ncbi:phosphopantetheine-binding protein [Cellulosilyticum ruminicola]|uniref:phosphopantetheine-binding protein n=1 Tax=Cellulosilyticum ruminicola TaxID=425254 RepID=UPI0006D04706|nr:phosphopantetheine-binding protein [Cellulosilyticum ruminicola]
MSKEEIFEMMKENISEIIPEIDVDSIDMQDSLKELGINSIDRMDIIVDTMEALNLRLPMVKFGRLKNIEEIIMTFMEEL